MLWSVWGAVLMVALVSGGADGTITCRAVTSRYQSSVTCDFGVNIFDTKHNFNLQFYYPDLSADPETPLMCNWMASDDVKCVAGEGVLFDKVIADQLTVRGPPIRERLGGKFVCQVIPAMDVPVEPCEVIFKDVETTTPTPTTTTTTTTTTPTPTPNEMLEEISDRTRVLLITTVVIPCILLIVVVLIFIVLLRIFKKKRSLGRARQESEAACQTSLVFIEAPEDVKEAPPKKMGLLDRLLRKKSSAPENEPLQTDLEPMLCPRDPAFTSGDDDKEAPAKARSSGIFKNKSSAPETEPLQKDTEDTEASVSMSPVSSQPSTDSAADVEGTGKKESKRDKRKKSREMRQTR